MLGLTKQELAVFKKLKTPIQIQNFLDTLPINWEEKGDTDFSPRKVLRENKAHCLEGALFASVALWLNGEKPLLMDLKTADNDDHVVALYKRNGYWGAISKTNHATVRFRDPVYKTTRELAVSYFHEYFNDDTGKKVLQSYSVPFNLKKYGTKWITSEESLDFIAADLDDAKHYQIFPKENLKYIRVADKMERKAGRLKEWSKKDRRT